MPKIIVEGPDGKQYAFPDTMPREQINTFMRDRYGTKATGETVDQYLARVVREQDATKARAQGVTEKATQAGASAREDAAGRMGIDSPLMMAVGAPALGMAQQAGARSVYDAEGTVLADEAAGLNAINAAGFLLPGMLNKDFGAQAAEGRRQQPLAAFAGDAAGGFGAGEVISAGVMKAGQLIGPQVAKLGGMFKGKPIDDVVPSVTISPEERAMLTGQPATGPTRTVSPRTGGASASDPEYMAARKQAVITPEEMAVLMDDTAEESTVTAMLERIRKRQAKEAKRAADLEDAMRIGKEEFSRIATDEEWAAQGFPPRTMAEIKPMGYGDFRPRVAKRETRAEPFFDERLTPQQNKAVEMRRNGFTNTEIADEMDISESHVSVAIAKAKAKGVDIGKLAKDRKMDDILALKQKGLSPVQIAERLQIDRSSVNVQLSRERRRLQDAGEALPDWLTSKKGRPVSFGQMAGDAADLAENAFGLAFLTGAGSAGIKELGSRMKEDR